MFIKLSAADTGISFVNENIETERSNIFSYEYFYNGGGVAVGDINNDGLADLYLSSNIFSNKLYLNQGNFKFEDITESSGTASESGWKTGVTMVDINADGLLDIYVCQSAGARPEDRRNVLLINNGDLTFTDRANEFGLNDDSFSTHAAFFDFDRDDDLDVILLNHSLLSISNSFNISSRNTRERYPFVGNKLLRNDGNKFIDVSDSVGVFGPASNYGLGVSVSDINNDGWPDIYTGCDYTGRDRLLLNNNGLYFYEATDSLLTHISKFTMGTDIADFNGDGLMDIYTLDMLPEDNHRQKQLMGADNYDTHHAMVKNGLHAQYMRNMLHLNNGNGTFSEIGQLAGVSNTDWSWAPLFADFDNDGTLDLFVTNGFKRDLTDNDFSKYKAFQEIASARRQGSNVNFLDVISKFHENKIPNYIYRGNGDLTFSNKTIEWGVDESTLTNGAAYADLDNDGDLDLILNNVNEEAGIYRNNTERNGLHFLRLKLIGSEGNPNAIGTKVIVYAEGKSIAREQFPVRGFQSSVDPVLHFGLGAVSRVDSIAIRWPDGKTKLLVNIDANQMLSVTQNDGETIIRRQASSKPLFTSLPGHVPFTHIENSHNDFRTQPLLPRMYSTQGPALAVGDVNGDGLEDLFCGAAKGQSGELFIQAADGSFKRKQAFVNATDSEDVDAIFFDMDNDGDVDLFVASGGYELSASDPALQDHLYENDGNGHFSERKLPSYLTSTGCVRAADADSDGDIDLFVGSRISPGRYPEAPQSNLLLNDGKGGFSSATLLNDLARVGMVTDAVWADVNGDTQQDLVVVGEWMAIRVFINNRGTFSDSTRKYFSDATEGFWNSIVADDFDKDGDVDFVAGNMGLNTQMKASPTQPAVLYYADFDDNGSIDPILTYHVLNGSYPYASRDELIDQVPSLKKRFTTYAKYSDATIEQVLSTEALESAKKLRAFQTQSVYVRNNSGAFEVVPMPLALQFAPVFALASIDINGDGYPDVVSGGNLSASRARTGKMTGNTGFAFLNDKNGNFNFVHPASTGLRLDCDVRKIQIIKGNGLVVGVNNAPVQYYVLNERDSN